MDVDVAGDPHFVVTRSQGSLQKLSCPSDWSMAYVIGGLADIGRCGLRFSTAAVISVSRSRLPAIFAKSDGLFPSSVMQESQSLTSRYEQISLAASVLLFPTAAKCNAVIPFGPGAFACHDKKDWRSVSHNCT